MAYSFYKILDKNGVEMPDHWSGRRRTYDEAKKMVDGLNKNGEHSPYTMIEINRNNIAQQTAVEWLVEQIKSDQNQKALSPSEWMQVINQAKQMEKQQIIDAANTLLYCGTGPGDMWAEQYYNETYGKDSTGI